jgi:hypothetical protein
VDRERERRGGREKGPQDRVASPPLRMGPAGPVDDYGDGPMLCPGATCGVRPNGTGGVGQPGRKTGDVHPAEMGDVRPPTRFMT